MSKFFRISFSGSPVTTPSVSINTSLCTLKPDILFALNTGYVLERAAEKYPTIKAFSADAGYRGTAVTVAEETLDRPLHVSTKIKDVWAVLPKRFLVERTFSWINNYRRLAKDFEVLTATSENMIRLAMIKLTLAKCV